MTATDSSPSEYTAALGKRIRQARISRDLSLGDVELATNGQLKAVTLGSYERGDRHVSAETLAFVAGFLDVSPGWLLTGESDTADIVLGAEVTA